MYLSSQVWMLVLRSPYHNSWCNANRMGNKGFKVFKSRKIKILRNLRSQLMTKFVIFKDGHGIGDDKCSVAIDGCRQLLWYNAQSESQSEFERCWRPGDIIGTLLDVDKEEVIFYHNGKVIKSSNHIFTSTPKSGFFAAASFMSFQQCLFNFGSTPFKFPPKRKYQAFNDQGHLDPDEKVIWPKHLLLEMLSKDADEDACTLCVNAKAW